MPRPSLRFALALAALTVVAGVLLGLRARTPSAPLRSPSAPSVAASPTLGVERAWNLLLDASIATPGRDAPITFRLAGTWVTTVSAERPGERDVACEVRQARVSGTGVASPPPAEIEAVARRLSRTFFITYRDDGAAIRAHFPRDMDPADRNLLLLVVTASQWILPPAGQTAWTTNERDAAGRYLAMYRRGGDGRIDKRKVKYLDESGARLDSGTGGPGVTVEGSRLQLTLDAADEVTGLSAADHLRVGVPLDKGQWVDLRVALQLDGLRRSRADAQVGALARTAGSFDSGPIVTQRVDPDRARAQQDRRLLEGQRAGELLAAAAKRSDEDEVLSARLAALVRTQPESAAAIEALARRTDAPTWNARVLASANCRSGTDALLHLAGGLAVPAPQRVAAITALLLLERPDEAALRALLGLFSAEAAPVRSAARLVAAGLVHKARTRDDADPEADPSAGVAAVCQAVDEALLTLYRTASERGDREERSDLLAALGNSASPAVTPTLLGASADADASVRITAVRALRLAPGETVEERLRAALADGDHRVRLSAIEALGFRDIAPVAGALQQAARQDSAEEVRSGAVSLLARRPELRGNLEAIRAVADHDPRPGVRRLARDALTRTDAAPHPRPSAGQ